MSLNQPSPTQIPIFEALSKQVAKFHPRWIQWFNEVDQAITYLYSLVIPSATTYTVGMVFDGGGSPPTVGSVGYLVCQRAGTIDQWSVVADAAGSAVVDVWKAAGAIPTVADTIAGTEKPTLTAQQLNSDTSLTTWTTTVAAGDVFGFSIDSVTTCTRLTVEVRIQES